MKVLKGYLKGHEIICPKNNIRPLMSVLKEYAFQKLENIFLDFSNLSLLDLFCGSASVSIEAISQGFKYCASIEQDKSKISTLLKNVKITDSVNESSIKLYFLPCEKFVLFKKHPAFDCIFADPPFAYKYKNDLLNKILNSDKIKSNTILILHHPTKEDIVKNIENLEYKLCMISDKNFGNSTIKFYEIFKK